MRGDARQFIGERHKRKKFGDVSVTAGERKNKGKNDRTMADAPINAKKQKEKK
jgi:hypothetical protein